MVYGDNRIYNVALVVPDMESLKKWAEGQGVATDSAEKLLESSKVRELMMGEVEKYSAEFKGFEKIKRITLTAEDFTTQNDMITPSMKVKRRVVWQKYGPQIEALYNDASAKEEAAQAAS